MFTNLVESSSHAKEFRRRGSFFLFTIATYAVLFVVTGVVSIYAYDARLEKQNLEIITTLTPVEYIQPEQQVVHADKPQSIRDNDNPSNIPTREISMARIEENAKIPDTISTTPNTHPPRPTGPYKIGKDDTPEGPGGSTKTSCCAGGKQPGSSTPVEIEEPPPAPETRKVPKILSKGPITGDAKVLPPPPYPPLAIQMRIQGKVSVQVLIDEQGRVISATAIDGHPFLRPAAQKAAFQAQFSPTTLNNQPVKVSGVITYDFKLTN
mgnify:FL=1